MWALHICICLYIYLYCIFLYLQSLQFLQCCILVKALGSSSGGYTLSSLLCFYSFILVCFGVLYVSVYLWGLNHISYVAELRILMNWRTLKSASSQVHIKWIDCFAFLRASSTSALFFLSVYKQSFYEIRLFYEIARKVVCWGQGLVSL